MSTERAPIDVLLRSVQSGEHIAVMDNTVGAGLPGPPLHRHDFDETFYVLEAAQNMGRTGPIPPPTPMGDPGAALLVGVLLWALVSVVVATKSANQGMRRRKWGWVASFLVASLVAVYAFGRFV